MRETKTDKARQRHTETDRQREKDYMAEKDRVTGRKSNENLFELLKEPWQKYPKIVNIRKRKSP